MPILLRNVFWGMRGWVGRGKSVGVGRVHGCLCAAIGFVKEEKKDVFVFCLINAQ